WVMSDWGAVHTTAKAALAGLDQESGEQLDRQVYFGPPLKEAVEQGEVPFERLATMVRRILRSAIDKGLFDHPAEKRPTDYAANGAVALAAAEAGIVLLKNDGVLPLGPNLRKIAVIGGHADKGVLSGGGSSQVIPVGGPAHEIAVTIGPSSAFSRITYHPSAPLAAIRALARNAAVTFEAGTDRAAAVAAAREADVAIVFADQWATEAEDLPTLSLPHDQDVLIAAVCAANRKTVVVLETGTPVVMPWLEDCAAVLEAWYPGGRGGEAIGNILFGASEPSGRLPISFPQSTDDLPRPQVPGMIFGPPVEGATIPTSFPDVQQHKGRFSVEHPEGAETGYRWYARSGRRPLFPFGFGLSYTRFGYAGLTLAGGETVTASFDVTNLGDRPGIEVAQVYATVTAADGGPSQRLIGWARVGLEPGETRRVSVTADPRLLAAYDVGVPGWRIAEGPVSVSVGTDAATPVLAGAAKLAGRTLKP
ncbi:MAG: beta-glucosidase, partial [Phenylobacterium sp.]|nr:beta-glucosidase [Phenylobacterium sp.]